MISAGKYLGKIIKYGVGMANNGNPRIDIQFEFKDEKGIVHELWWAGYVTEKAIKITAKALVVCGLKGTDYDALKDGIASGLLDTNLMVELDVVHDTYNGVTREKIAWVNAAGTSKPKSTEPVNLNSNLFKDAIAKAREASDIPF